MNNFVSQFVLHSLGDYQRLPVYSKALLNAFETSPPPYGEDWFGKQYRFLSRNPSWFASLLVSDVDLEGYSAKQLWAYAHNISNLDFAEGLKLHAIDEARHSKMFINILFTIFPNLETEELNQKLTEMAPILRINQAEPLQWFSNETSLEEILNSAILITLHEAKALILEQFLLPILVTYSPDSKKKKIEKITRRLISDEINHITYSAKFIESMAKKYDYQDYIFDAMEDFQRMINLVTLEEAENATDSLVTF